MASTVKKTSAAAQFWTDFQKECESIQKALDDVRPGTRQPEVVLDGILRRINDLQTRVTEALVYIATYDEQQYTKQLAALTEQLNAKRAQLAPRKRFTFRNRPTGSSSATTTTTTTAIPAPTETVTNETSASVDTTIHGESTYKIHERQQAHICLRQTVSEHTTQTLRNDGYLADLTDCIVDLRLPDATNQTYQPLSALHVNRLKRCLVLVGTVDGSVMLHDCQQCIFILACRQYRMHTSQDCNIYMHCSSRPIIEKCNHIQFAPLPTPFDTQLLLGTTLAEEENHWQKVDDFLWIKRHLASPHWSVLDEEKRSSAYIEALNTILAATPSDTLTDVSALHALLPTTTQPTS